MKEKVMFVSASRESTNVSIYEVETNNNEVVSVRVLETKEWSLKPSDLIKIIKNTYEIVENITSCIIDITSSGIFLADTLMLDEGFELPIYRIKTALTQERNRCVCKLLEYMRYRKITVDTNVDLDLSKLNSSISTTGNGTVRLSNCDSRIGDLALFIGNVETYKTNIKKEDNRNKIERNLKEIVEILIDDLSQLDKSDVGAVNDLVRLIDKVNYIRGQY